MQTLVERLYENKPLMFAAAIIAFLIAALLLLLIIRMLFGGRLRMPGGRTRQARLGIVDAFDLDRQRQLIIVRRDNTEHLIMIGGPNDLLIESEIIRVEARDQRDVRRDKVDGPVLPIGTSLNEPRIPAPFAPVERQDPSKRSHEIEPAPPSFNLADQPLPSPLPPPIPAASLDIDMALPIQPAPQPVRTPTFPLPPRRPPPPAPERRPPVPSRPMDRITRTEPAAPSLDLPPAPLPDEPPVPVMAPVPATPVVTVTPPLPTTLVEPATPSAPAPPATPAPRPAPPPFLRPLPPRTPKILQRTPAPTKPPVAPPPAAVVPPIEATADPAPPAILKPLTPAPAAPASSPNDTLESLEEEMAKLLGRGSSE